MLTVEHRRRIVIGCRGARCNRNDETVDDDHEPELGIVFERHAPIGECRLERTAEHREHHATVRAGSVPIDVEEARAGAVASVAQQRPPLATEVAQVEAKRFRRFFPKHIVGAPERSRIDRTSGQPIDGEPRFET